MASQFYVFTLNNYTDAEVDTLKKTVVDGRASYIIWGKEVGEQGTPHLQGYIELKKRYSIRQLKKFPGFARASFFNRMGTQVWPEGEGGK